MRQNSRYKPPLPEPDPEHFGYQRDNSYAPSPGEIAERCEAIKAALPADELRRRGAWGYSEAWTAPEMAVFDTDDQ